ncbi:outer membrane lipid asymmetry maintenance protein MlaD [Denitromonas ohlonensis]|uniref:Outer membrane lipid asymmetry maintenance protein MlaD n=2 Tax=Denitromonas TaxID=139331 RepID=A0A557S4J3_9RHOO|nr:outer membrane lipid asymmetry maintenance protein MlaD [Denitromonas ohlonensis]TVO62466.1 outer membrane lipid asymmetry maintenance protein MlaD [Denitromonas ohlonensis]TVO72321.1 outer membrane lipid asymmetry maintenance protein MlaD [Denitromonas ohlonensis]TVT77738.1 MAG: outer membrane lipid asymmetry maintenance protein MlaD [Denitromonas halophila]
MSRSTIDLWVGIFVLMGCAAILFLALKVGNLSASSFAENYTIEANFSNIGGLKVRAPVKVAGVVVGRVTDIRYDNERFEAVVSLTLDSRYSFPRDTIGEILTSGLLGEQYIGLEPGGDERALKAGDSLKITQSAVVLEKLIGQFLFNKAAEAPQQ